MPSYDRICQIVGHLKDVDASSVEECFVWGHLYEVSALIITQLLAENEALQAQIDSDNLLSF